jgi:hypothetical protein
VIANCGGYFGICLFGGKKLIAHKMVHSFQPFSKTQKIEKEGQNNHFKEQIKEVLGIWKHHMDKADYIWIYAPGKNRFHKFNIMIF